MHGTQRIPAKVNPVADGAGKPYQKADCRNADGNTAYKNRFAGM